jgi:hypothetical protein
MGVRALVLFRAVRIANRAKRRQLRVLLGDPPIDWDGVLRGSDRLERWVRDRDHHAVEVIRREVLAKHRRALVIYGGGHLFRASQSLVRPLEDIAKVRVFTIATATSTRFEDLVALQPNATSWHAPSLATIRGTALEAKQLGYYDALLYLGPPSAMTMSQLSPTLCSDRNYVEMRLWRLAVGPKSGIARFKRDCELPP